MHFIALGYLGVVPPSSVFERRPVRRQRAVVPVGHLHGRGGLVVRQLLPRSPVRVRLHASAAAAALATRRK